MNNESERSFLVNFIGGAARGFGDTIMLMLFLLSGIWALALLLLALGLVWSVVKHLVVAIASLSKVSANDGTTAKPVSVSRTRWLEAELETEIARNGHTRKADNLALQIRQLSLDGARSWFIDETLYAKATARHDQANRENKA